MKSLSEKLAAKRAANLPRQRSGDPSPIPNVPENFDYRAAIMHVTPDKLRLPARKLLKNEDALAFTAARIITTCGAVIPILASASGEVIVGGEYVKAYVDAGYDTVPVIYAPSLSDGKVHALRLSS